jgi:hypothetical protein
MVDKVALGRVFSEYFGFPCQSSFHQILWCGHTRASYETAMKNGLVNNSDTYQ